ncbi:MAG: ParB/RepB/Spo0J family partition protein, partial [Thermoguttaceae bacterium]|nr:ParB/RepB/Spo0J family partition protein [Thermoguttaceae bacterium]
MSKEKRLGRGLEALLGKVAVSVQPESDQDETNMNGGLSVISADDMEHSGEHSASELPDGLQIRMIAIDLIDRNPAQPRVDFDAEEITRLAQSIQQCGLIQPIAVRPEGDRFVLIVGERRLRAAREAGLTEIPACVQFQTISEQEMAELALTENMLRQDLNAMEKATAFRNYLDTYGGTQEELGKRLQLNRSTVANLMRLLDLPDDLQRAVRTGDLTPGHARALLPLEEWEQLEVAQRILDESWNVRQTEAFVQDMLANESDEKSTSRPVPKKANEPSEQVLELERQFRGALGMKVKLTANEKCKGKLVI